MYAVALASGGEGADRYDSMFWEFKHLYDQTLYRIHIYRRDFFQFFGPVCSLYFVHDLMPIIVSYCINYKSGARLFD